MIGIGISIGSGVRNVGVGGGGVGVGGIRWRKGGVEHEVVGGGRGSKQSSLWRCKIEA